jgi:hypothetical protein
MPHETAPAPRPKVQRYYETFTWKRTQRLLELFNYQVEGPVDLYPVGTRLWCQRESLSVVSVSRSSGTRLPRLHRSTCLVGASDNKPRTNTTALRTLCGLATRLYPHDELSDQVARRARLVGYTFSPWPNNYPTSRRRFFCSIA